MTDQEVGLRTWLYSCAGESMISIGTANKTIETCIMLEKMNPEMPFPECRISEQREAVLTFARDGHMFEAYVKDGEETIYADLGSND